MEEMAWVLRTDTKRNSIGFVRASDLAPKHRFVLAEDDDFWTELSSRHQLLELCTDHSKRPGEYA